jgi:hypothetical protein
MTPRASGRGRVARLGALATAVAATVALSQATASGAFAGATGNAANSASSAPTFCTKPPSRPAISGDSWTDESPGYTDTNHQNDLELRVRSSSAGDRHIWIGFDLPANPDPAHCQLVAAKLSLYNKAPASGRYIDVYRGNPNSPWTAATITWTNEPGLLTPAATNALTPALPGWQEWVVTTQVQAQYTGGNNGFVLKDRTENAGTPREQVYYDRQDTAYRPTLVLTWG